MAHVQAELARERQRTMLAAAAAQREGRRAWIHGRIVKRVERAERRQVSGAHRAEQLRARLSEIESGS